MTSIRKRNGGFQAQIRRLGATKISKTFANKKDGIVWISRIEVYNDLGETNLTAPKAITPSNIVALYSQEITPTKKRGANQTNGARAAC